MPGGTVGRSEFLSQPVDVMATVLELGNAPIPEGVQGISLVPILQGESVVDRPVAVTSSNLVDNPNRGVCSSITDGVWTLHYRGSDHLGELYNIAEDPKEKNDLYTSNRPVAEKLHAAHLNILKAAGTSQRRMELRSKLP